MLERDGRDPTISASSHVESTWTCPLHLVQRQSCSLSSSSLPPPCSLRLASTLPSTIMLAACCARRIYTQSTHRAFGTAGRVFPSKAYTDAPSSLGAGTSGSPKDITTEQKRVLDAALRVDQAGEVAANYIYMGQLAVLGRDRVCGPLIQVSNICWQHGFERSSKTYYKTIRKCGTKRRNI